MEVLECPVKISRQFLWSPWGLYNKLFVCISFSPNLRFFIISIFDLLPHSYVLSLSRHYFIFRCKKFGQRLRILFFKFFRNRSSFGKIRSQLFEDFVFLKVSVGTAIDVFSFGIEIDESLELCFALFAFLILITLVDQIVENDVFDFFEEIQFCL